MSLLDGYCTVVLKNCKLGNSHVLRPVRRNLEPETCETMAGHVQPPVRPIHVVPNSQTPAPLQKLVGTRADDVHVKRHHHPQTS